MLTGRLLWYHSFLLLRYCGAAVLAASGDELIEVDEFLGDARTGLQLLQLLHELGVRVHTYFRLHDVMTESHGKLKGVLFSEATPPAGTGSHPPRQQQPVRSPRGVFGPFSTLFP